ncbi:MAG: long-chain fatty acid--CoA ligase [Chloroflexota bacterium]|nr:long-chain fatty acid--CoA ligase [Chloroflexota bacterium]MDE2908339.1 long-chain fatty acid--CoA ligase [Chloroflexota bacterium]
MLAGLMMDYPLTLNTIVEHARRMTPRKPIKTKLPDGSWHEYSYADLHRRVRQLGNVLAALGVEPGDRVATFAWNNYQHLEFYFGIPCAGAVVHTLNVRLSQEQLKAIIDHAEDKVIFVDGSLLPLIEPIAERLETVEHIVIFNDVAGRDCDLPNLLHYEDLMAAASDEYEWRCADENMAQGLCYTSGTTGMPKGVLYSHRSMMLHTLGVLQAAALGPTEADVVLPVVPQFHAMAWGLPYAATWVGASIVMPGPHLQPAPLADMIESERVTIAAGVPTIWNGLYHELRSKPRDISSITQLVVGGSAMPRGLIEAYERDFGVNVVHAWGMTELSPIGSVAKLQTQHQDLDEGGRWDIKAKQGYFVPGVDARIVDDAGAELPWDGETMGELQVRGYWVAGQYYQRENDHEHFTADGWFRTGDVVMIDANGFMTITDRTKDLVKSGGEWISSVDLENMLISHADVLEAAVIAVPDERWGERPLAVIAPLDGGCDAAALNAYLLERFPKFWLPDRYVIVDEIPKTGVGKMDKKALRQRYAEGKL